MNASFTGEVSMEVTLEDLDREDQAVVRVATAGLAQCVHASESSMDACLQCTAHKRKAMGDWCTRHKAKARRVVQHKVNDSLAREHGQGSRGPAPKTDWEVLPCMHACIKQRSQELSGSGKHVLYTQAE